MAAEDGRRVHRRRRALLQKELWGWGWGWYVMGSAAGAGAAVSSNPPWGLVRPTK